MADILFNKQKFGDLYSPLQAATIVQQANSDISESLSKEVNAIF